MLSSFSRDTLPSVSTASVAFQAVQIAIDDERYISQDDSRIDDTDSRTEISAVSGGSSQRLVSLVGLPFHSDTDTWSDDSVISTDTHRRQSLTTMETLCASTLIDNKMAVAMADKKEHGKVNKLQRALSSPMFEISETMQGADTEFILRSHLTGIGAAETIGVEVNHNYATRDKHSLRTADSSIQDACVIELFSANAARHLKPHHNSLISVTQYIFGLDDNFCLLRSYSSGTDAKREALLKDLQQTQGYCPYEFTKSRMRVASFTNSSPFTIFFMLLTVYALFGPDIVLLTFNSEYDETFITLNTVIMFLFVMEFIMMSYGVENYACSLAASLDLLAIFSLLSDTWFLQASNVSDNRLVHDTRLARLTRITRVARITRLVPRLIRLFRQQKKTGLARRLLVRRLRRAFHFLDIDRDGMVSSFDFKCFYLTILQECSQLLLRHKHDILSNDADILLACAPDGNIQKDREANLDFEAFASLFFATWVGHDVLQRHVEDLENSSGVWAMTSKVTDRTALTVCIGLLFLIIVMKLLEVESEELSGKQGLFHLYGLLMAESRRGVLNQTIMCDHVAVYLEDLKVLFLHMDGVTWKDYRVSQCPAPLQDKPFDRMESIMRLSKLRKSEVVTSCLPNFDGRQCERDTAVAVSLIDDSDEVKRTIFYASLSIMCTILIVLGFVVVFSHGITTFSRSTLHPLRGLVDDVMALSSIELVHVDAETAEELHVMEATHVAEILHLQKSFKSMRFAIRSWSRYVPPSVVQKLFNAGMEATIGVSKLIATILFVDVDGFEDACRGLAPREVNHLLASVFEQIALAVSNNRGTLLEFIGDEVLAVYNTPNSVKSHVHCAVNSALDVHKYVSTLPTLKTQDGRDITIRCRCGVHTACILAGNIGSQRRMKYGLLGDGVNLTARLKGLNSRFNTQTIASDKVATDELSSRRAVFRPLDRVIVKGKTEPTTVYEVLCVASRGEVAQTLKKAAQKHTEAFNLYQTRQFVEAKALFREVSSELESVKNRCRLSATEFDLPSRKLRKKCSALIRKPPPPDWDGVEHLKAKSFDITRHLSLVSTFSQFAKVDDESGYDEPFASPCKSDEPRRKRHTPILIHL